MILQVSGQVETRLISLDEREGLAPSAFIEKLLAEYRLDGLIAPIQDPTLALLKQWHEEDVQMTGEEAE